MEAESEDVTDHLLRNGYDHCNDCNEVLPKMDLNQHCEREHNQNHRLPNSNKDETKSFDANNNILKDIKPENASNPFNRKPIEANGVNNENREASTYYRGRILNSFLSGFNRENVSPNVPVKSVSKLAIKFPTKAMKNDSFDENIDKKSNGSVETRNLIDFCNDDEINKSVVADTTVSSNENVPNNAGNPFKVKVEHPFDLEKFNWNGVAGQIVVKAKNAQDNDDHDDESMMAVMSTSCESDAIDDAVDDVPVPNDRPRIINAKGVYFLHCRECNNNVLSLTWHEHMKRVHDEVIDPDCVPECANGNMKAVFCRKCHNVMPQISLAQHIVRKHRAKGIVGFIMRGGPDDETFNKMVKFGKIHAKDGTIFNADEDNK